MSLSRNLLAGLANSGWSALLGLAVVPFYLKYLGIEAYGLIGFFVTLQAMLGLLDMGMTPTINREVARCSASGKLHEAGPLLHTLAVVYWSVAIAISFLIACFAAAIAQHWLHSKQLSQQTVLHAVMLMGLVVACRWPIGLYQGAMSGAQRLILSSAISITMATIGSLGAVAVLAFVSPTIEAFFIWQACVGLVYAVTTRMAAWRVIGTSRKNPFAVGYIRRIWRFSLSVSAISLAGLALTQMDKLILSKTLGLEGFGNYMLATLVASSLYILIVPFFNAIYPRFSALVVQKNDDALLQLYRGAGNLMAVMLFPASMTIILLSQDLIGLWTGNAALGASVAPVASILLAAYALHGVMYIPYALMLAYGETRSMYRIYGPLIIGIVPLTIMLSLQNGAIGGALAQLLLFVVYAVFGTWITHKRFLKGWARTWLSKEVGLPLGISVAVGVVGYLVLPKVGDAWYLKLSAGMAFWVVAAALSIQFSRYSRLIFVRYWNQFCYR